MKIGTQLPAMMPLWAPKWTPQQVAEAAIAVGRAADRLGYEWVSVPEHQILPPRARVYKGPWYDPLMTLSYVAAATERVRLFTNILVAPYHEPVVLAKAVASLDLLSGGRVILGVGSGNQRGEFEALQVPFEERGAITDEWLALLRALWETELVTFEGKYYHLRDMNFEPKPERRITIWAGGHSYKIVRRAVDLCDGWCPALISLDKAKEMAAYLAEYRAKRGVQREITWMLPFGNWIRASMVTSPAPGKVDDPRYVMLNAVEEPGDPAYLIERLSRLRAAGVYGTSVSFIYNELPELLESLEWFAQEVMHKL
jgi:probable F420-dependent oxidoreductase